MVSNENILPSILNDVQHQVLIGGLLGDFSMSKDGKFPRVKVDRQSLDKDYINWQFSIFKDLCLSPVREFERYDKRYDKTHKYVSFRTRAVPAFLPYYQKWYPNGVRQVPSDIEFTPLILAIWFSDDGCIINEKGQSLTLKLSTESFGKIGAEILSSKLEEKFNKKFPIYRKKKDKDQFFIKAGTCATQSFLKEIENHVISVGMTRKYNIWKTIDLNIKPKLGAPLLRNNCIDDLILKLKDFSANEICNLSKIDILKIRSYLAGYYKLGYFERYESKDKYNLLHFKLNEKGYNFFSNKNDSYCIYQ